MILTKFDKASKESCLQMADQIADFKKTPACAAILWEFGHRREKALDSDDLSPDKALGIASAHKNDHNIFNELQSALVKAYESKGKKEIKDNEKKEENKNNRTLEEKVLRQ